MVISYSLFPISYSLFPISYFPLYVYYLISPVAKIRLEAYTERSESNPGHSLGIYDTNKDGCLEDSTLHWVYSYAFGTVFQTAFLYHFIIPRLRPGLLSLRSVLSSRQSYLLPITYNQQPTTTLFPIDYLQEILAEERRDVLVRDGEGGHSGGVAGYLILCVSEDYAFV